jgi:hypothetical protein
VVIPAKKVEIMRKLFKVFIIIFITTLTSCSDSDTLQNESFDESTVLKQVILEKNLDLKHDIPGDVYEEFVDNLIFDEKGNVVGAIYDKIESHLDDNSSNKFWKNFGFEVRKSKDDSSNNVARVMDPVIFEGYKPKRGGCRSNSRWICVIRSY